MTDGRDATTDAARLRRRRFLGAAGIAAGTAWVAPSVISSTPAAAGVPSSDPCAPTISGNAYNCSSGGFFGLSVPDGCPDVAIVRESSINGGPFVELDCLFGNVFGSTVGAGLTDTVTFRYTWFVGCVTRMEIQSFLSIQMGGCPPPGASPGGGES